MNISVVISTYGDEEWAELAWSRAYPSVWEQDHPNEVIIDHIPDATIAQVRNALARKATGDWLCFLDADDELAPGFLDSMRRAEQRTPSHRVPALFTPAVSYVRKGRAQPPKFNDRGISLQDDNWLIVGTLIRKDLFMEIGGFNDYEHGFEDFSLWNKAWQMGAQIVKVPDAVYLAHINPNSDHRRRWRDRKWQVQRHMEVVEELQEWGRQNVRVQEQT